MKNFNQLDNLPWHKVVFKVRSMKRNFQLFGISISETCMHHLYVKQIYHVFWNTKTF